MPQLGAKIRRLDVKNDARADDDDDDTDARAVKVDEEDDTVRLHDGETANFEISLTNISNR